MKKIIRGIVLLSIATMAIFMSQACSGDKKTEVKRSESGELLQEDSIDNEVRRMQLTSREYTATIGSNAYSIHITRLPDDNLPTVLSDMDVRYTDNRVVLNIKKGDNVVVNREFTKNDFAGLLPGPFLNKSVLSGMVYNKVEGGKIILAASACYPQTDMCIPVILSVSTDGQISMVKSEQLEDDYDR